MDELHPAGAEAARAGFEPALDLECSVCGYGARRSTPPDRCPMCQGEGTWIRAPRRSFNRNADALSLGIAR